MTKPDQNLTKDPTKHSTSATQRDKQYNTDRDEAASRIERAFALAGLVGDRGKLVCPGCGKVGKTKLMTDGKAHCFAEADSPGYKQRNAIDVLVTMGWTFSDAVDDLLERPRRSTVRTGQVASPKPREFKDLPKISGFVAKVDTEVYRALLDAASIKGAQDFYARWHISPEAVALQQVARVMDPKATFAELLRLFGEDRLVASGVAMRSDERVFPLFSARYPIIEPHIHPDGRRVLSMQFRASELQEPAIAEYKAVTKARRAAKERGEEVGPAPDFVSKFLSLNGSPVPARVGFGLPAIRRAAEEFGPGLKVRVVEGMKDVLAANTMNRIAYAVPGAGVMPPDNTMAEFVRLGVELEPALDGDLAGENGKEKLLARAAEWYIPAEPYDLPEGQDVTDMLVGWHAKKGDTCPACIQWLKANT